MRSHTGVVMILVKGAMYYASTKQKLNTKSSMEAELVAIDDAMAQVLRTRHFLVAQGEYVPTTTIYQDNKSSILLAENGKQSSSQQTRHLNVRYFFVSDKIKKGEVKVAFCPTHDMLADFYQATSSNTIQANVQQDTKPALQYKSSSSQECSESTKFL